MNFANCRVVICYPIPYWRQETALLNFCRIPFISDTVVVMTGRICAAPYIREVNDVMWMQLLNGALLLYD